MESFKTKKDLYLLLKRAKVNFNNYSFLLTEILKCVKVNFSDSARKSLELSLRHFCNNLHSKWVSSSYNESKFLNKHEAWLKQNYTIPEVFLSEIFHKNVSKDRESDSKNNNFNSFSDRHKNRLTEQLRNKFSSDELMHASKLKLKAEGKSDMAAILNYLIENPDKARKIKDICENNSNHVNMCTKDKALGIIISLKLSRYQYNSLRNSLLEDNINYYPSYYKIKQAKNECYPPRDSINLTSTGASIKLQALLDHTVSRILLAVSETKNVNIQNKLVLISKWGCDGASGQSNYKQISPNNTFENDSSIFMISLVPIKLYDPNLNIVIWENDRPSSTHFCRPLKFEFENETTSTIITETNSIESEISNLVSSLYQSVEVEHKLVMTMIDGKVCNAITNTSSAARCYICNAKPTEMNDLSLVKKNNNKIEYYKYGLSSLHAWIRCYECLLHISYNLDFKKWSATNSEHKELKLKKKKLIQQRFKKEMGLNIDIVKQGVGTTNDGNTARRFFENPQKVSEITGLNETLVKNFSVILQVVSSGQRVDCIKFGEYCFKTAERYINLYKWYYMPSSVHKLLLHGSEIIRHAIVPIGQLSEEAQEARNKDFKKYREWNSRKCSRKATNEDILNNLLLSSDPYITMIRPTFFKKNKKIMLDEALNLLLDNENGSSDSENELRVNNNNRTYEIAVNKEINMEVEAESEGDV